MARISLVAALVAFQSLAFAGSTIGGRHVLHEKRDEASPWIKRDVVSGDLELPMRIGLTQNNLHRGHGWLMEVSDPESSKYGQYYSAEETHDLFAPTDDAVSAVRAWLHEAGIAAERVSQSANKQWLQFDAQVAEAEELLKTKFHYYEHSSADRHSIGCDEYHVKDDIHKHIDYITPGLKMLELRDSPNTKAKRAKPKGWKSPIKTPLTPSEFATMQQDQASGSLQNCNSTITPACIMAMYNVTTGTTATKGNELGIFEEGGPLDPTDMELFFEALAKNIPNDTYPTVHKIDGARNTKNPTYASSESCLDFQISYPLIYPQQSVLFITDDGYSYEHAGLFNTFLDAIDGSYCTYSAFGETGNNKTVDPVYPDPHGGGYKGQLQCGVFKPTNVISLSYGLAEYGEGTSANYQKRQCNEYMKLGMQGITTVFSSGDAGVASNWGCQGKAGIFNPAFPANCPYVTAVGGTALTGAAHEDAERATTQFPSGGGFSNYFARPSYQSSAVETYFKSAVAPTFPYYTSSQVGNGVYNRSGRGIPDISAIGQNVAIYVDKKAIKTGGTSASAPTVAALFTRINEERLAAGKSTIGFVNPVLYKNTAAFHDITVGHNYAPGCAKGSGKGPQGFNVAPGWDPVTGLGTPNYPELLKVFMNLP